MRATLRPYDGTALATARRQRDPPGVADDPENHHPDRAPGTAMTVVGSGPSGPSRWCEPHDDGADGGQLHGAHHRLQRRRPARPATSSPASARPARTARRHRHRRTRRRPRPSPSAAGRVRRRTRRDRRRRDHGSNAKPAGTVEFTFEGKTVKVEVKGGKAKATLPPALTMGVAARDRQLHADRHEPGPQQASKAVRWCATRRPPTATAVYRDAATGWSPRPRSWPARHRGRRRSQVRAQARRRQDPDGHRAAQQLDKAKKVFSNISKPGRYTVVARYLGSPTLKRSSDPTR